jgi:hypothetical protein
MEKNVFQLYTSTSLTESVVLVSFYIHTYLPDYDLVEIETSGRIMGDK